MNDKVSKIRYGKYTRVCEVCGQEFKTNSKIRKLCYTSHTLKCVICGNSFLANVYTPARTCSPKCSRELIKRESLEKYGVKNRSALPESIAKQKKTNLERYGVDNIFKSEEFREKQKQINLEKYGVEYSVQREDVKEKIKQTNLKKYGVEYACTSKQAKEKTRQTNLKRYGVEHVFQDKNFQDRAKKSNLERYGTEYYVQNENFKEKAKSTNLEKYGVENPMQSAEIQKRVEKTSLEKYGTRRPQQSEEIKSRITEKNILNHADTLPELQRNNYLEFKKNPKEYVSRALRETKFGTFKIAHDTGLADPTLIEEVINKNLQDLTFTRLPHMEQEVSSFILALDKDIAVEHHNRKILEGKEIDIYLPQYKIGIECNPTFTHNSTNTNILGLDDCKPLSATYHQWKTDKSLEKGIFLLHIFGYEWAYNSDVIKSMICNLLGKCKDKYYARKLEVKEVPSKEAQQFLRENHRQRAIPAKINLGLYTKEGQLVSLMTFGHMRKSIGNSKNDTDKTYELSRFCSLKYTSVVGGASKLFKHFITHYDFDRIISFSDKAHTRGNLYFILGFQKVRESGPNYVWVNPETDLYLNRVSCQKNNLRKLFCDDTIDIEHETEQQIMAEHGFVQVFDSGTIRWEYTK